MNNIPTHLSPTRQFWKAIVYALGLTAIVCLLSFSAFAGFRKFPPVPSTTNPATQPAAISHAGPKYICAVFAQATYNMPEMKILGFNTLVSIPINHPPVPWAEEATRLGFYQIRPAVGVKALDEDNPLWIAYENPDEPDLNATPQAVIDANYDKAKAAGIPTFTNFDASRILSVQAPNFGPGASYASILAKTDWVSSDIHAVAGWNIDPVTKQNGAVSLWSAGYASDTLREMKGYDDNSQVLMYLETCHEDKWRAPTVAEMQVVMKQIDRRKLRGYIAFTFDFSLRWGTPPGVPNAFCGMDAEHREAVAEFNDSHQ